MVREGALPSFGASVILLAALTNGMAKAALGFAFGGARLGLVLLASFLAATASGAAVFLLLG